MTKDEFIAQVEAKPSFRKWAVEPVEAEKHGDIEKWNGLAYVDTPEGHTNLTNVWFMVDKATSEATWQNLDTLDSADNVIQAKYKTLETYCKDTFHAYEIKSVNLENNWAIVTTYMLTDGSFTKEEQIVYKNGKKPITHAPIV